MAQKKVRGLTIEIGGDTTGLSKAIGGIDSQLKNTQIKLKDVNKLLKMDPSNVTLLTQKQKDLESAISSTSDRLEKLKSVQTDSLSPEAYDVLQREIIETEQNLENLQNQYKEFGSVGAQVLKDAGEKMEAVGQKVSDVGQSLTAKITLPLVGVGTAGAAAFAEVDKTMQLTNKTMGNTAEEADLLNKAMKDAAANSTFGMSDAATATLNFARAGLDAEQAAAALAPAMNLAAGEGGNLDTVSGGLVATINGFHGSFEDAGHYADVFAAACNKSALDVDSLSNAMSVAAPVFSAAGYNVNDAALYMGVMANNGIAADKAANSLKTGLARLISPAKSGQEALKKLDWSITNADGTMKSSVQIQRELHDKFSELSEAEQIAAASAIFGKNQMAPWLALINTAPEDVRDLSNELDGASFSVTDFAKKMAESGMSLDDMKSNMEKLGVSSDDFDDILKYSAGDADSFADSLWEACKKGVKYEDVVAALGGDLDALGKVMSETVGTTDEMAEAMMSGFGGSIEKLKSSIDVLITSIGEALAPTIQKVTEFIQGLVDKFNALTPEQQKLIATIGMVVAAIGPALVIVGTAISKIGVAMKGLSKLSGSLTKVTKITKTGSGLFSKLSAVFSGTSGAVLAVGAAIGVLVAAFIHLWKNNEEFRKKMTAIWEKIKTIVSTFVDQFKKDVAALWEAMQPVIEKLKAAWDAFCEMLAPVFEFAFGQVATILETVTGIISDAIKGITALFKGDVTGALDALGSIFDRVWNYIGETVKNVGEAIKGVLDKICSWFGTDWNTVWTGVRDFMSGIWESIAGFFTGAWDTIKAVWEPVAEFFTSLWDKLHQDEKLGGILDAIAAPFQAAWAVIEGVWGAVTEFFSGIWGAITGDTGLGETLEAMSGPLVGAWEKVKEAWGTVTEFFSGIWEAIHQNETLGSIADVISAPFQTAWTVISAVWETVAAFFSGVWGIITGDETLAGLWKKLKEPFSTAWDKIKEIWGKVADVFAGIWKSITTNETLVGIATKISGFFTTAWDNIKKVWETVTEFFSNIWATITANETLAGILDAIKQPFEDAWGAIQTAWDAVSQYFADIWAAVTGDATLAEVLDVIKKPFVDAWTAISGAWDTVSKYFSDLWTAITTSETLATITSTISGFFTSAWDTIKTVWDAVSKYFSDLWTKISTAEGLKGIYDSITKWFSDTWKEVTASVTAVWEGAKKWGSNIVGNFTVNIKSAWNLVKKNVTGLWNDITNKVTEIWEGAKKWGPNIVGNFTTNIKAAWNLVKNSITGLWDDITNKVKDLWEAALKWGTNIVNNFKSSIKTAWTTAIEEIKGYFNQIPEAIQGIVDKALSWGQDLIDNFKSGITEKWDGLKSKVEGVANSIKDFLGFSVPKEGPLSDFDTYAPDMMDLFVKGINDNMHLITTMMGTLVSNIKSAFKLAGSGAYTEFDEALNGYSGTQLEDAIKGPIQDAADAISRIDWYGLGRTIYEGMTYYTSWISEAYRNAFDLSNMHVKTPHFYVSSWSEISGTYYPNFSVSWYRKAYDNPIMFTNPTILATAGGLKGFGDGPGGEIVLSADKLREIVGGAGDININVYAQPGQDAQQIAREVQTILAREQRQRSAAYA